MKRISILAAALLGAVLFFGCSSDSDSPAVPTGPALPAGVGTNEFAGKTLTLSNTYLGTTRERKNVFTANTITTIQTNTYADSSDASAYKKITETQSVYSYNSTTKSLYTRQLAPSVSYIERGGVKKLYKERESYYFTTDAEYLAAYIDCNEQIYDNLTKEQLEAEAKASRYWTFMSYGYTDSTGEDVVSNEIIAKFNKVRAANITYYLVHINAYEISGSTVKIINDSRFPAGLGLNEIYGVYNFTGTLMDGSTPTYTLTYSTNVYSDPALVKADGTEGYKVAAVTANALVISEKSSRESATIPYYMSYVAAPETISYTTTKNDDNTVTFDFGAAGKATATYATSTNVPDMTLADTWTISN